MPSILNISVLTLALFRYRQRRADVATKRATAHALVSLSSSRPAAQIQMVSPPVEISFSVNSAGLCPSVEVFQSETFAAAGSEAASNSVNQTSSDSKIRNSLFDQTADAQDCPIDRLLRAMACDKQVPVSPKTRAAAELQSFKSEVCAEITVDFRQSDSNGIKLTDTENKGLNSVSPEAGGKVMCVSSADSQSIWIGQLSPSRVCCRAVAAPRGLDALACTAAEILTRSCRPSGGMPVSPPAALSVLQATAGAFAARAAAAAAAFAEGADEDTDSSSSTRGRWERGDAQLSALSTPPYSPEVAAQPSGLLVLDPPLSLTV